MTVYARPENWKDLQNYVGKLFQEIGYEVEISKVVDLVRGRKEIDVYVKDTLSEFHPVFLVECKFWKKAVDQETVHAFHTVMNDFGANFGFIVSENGFQQGCYEAAKNTNIRLVSLEELEKQYHDKWQSGMVRRYLPLADMLFPYWDPSGGKMPKGGTLFNWENQQLVSAAYKPLIGLGSWDLNAQMKRKYPFSVPVINDLFKIEGQPL
jgi:hypothetical protein